MPTSHVQSGEQSTASSTTALAVELVDALYPQWAVNGHDLPAAFAVVADRHVDPVIAGLAEHTDLIPVVTETLEATFWTRLRAERQAQSV